MYKKVFDLAPGDRVKIMIPGRDPFTRGWGEGIVITAKFWGPEDGWYIEYNKDEVDPESNWELGYGYWKQGVDGGFVAKRK